MCSDINYVLFPELNITKLPFPKISSASTVQFAWSERPQNGVENTNFGVVLMWTFYPRRRLSWRFVPAEVEPMLEDGVDVILEPMGSSVSIRTTVFRTRTVASMAGVRTLCQHRLHANSATVKLDTLEKDVNRKTQRFCLTKTSKKDFTPRRN